MDFKYLVLDLDGTLLNDKSEIGYEDNNAILASSNKSELIIASGRHFSEITLFLNKLFVRPSFVICCDGVRVYDGKGHELQGEDNLLKKEDVATISDIVKTGSVFIITEKENYVFRESIVDRVKRKLKRKSIKHYSLGNSIKAEKIRISKKNITNETFGKLSSLFSVHLVFDKFVDIKKKAISKYSAIQYVCNLCNIDKNSVLYFGDDMNDIECFTNLKHCIAMGNACDEIKTRAEFITKTNNENGVAYALNYFCL